MRIKTCIFLVAAAAAMALMFIAWPTLQAKAPAKAVYRSPFMLASTADGQRLYVSDRTAECIVMMDLPELAKLAQWPLAGEPTGIALTAEAKLLLVNLYKANQLAVIDAATGKVVKRINVGAGPTGLAVDAAKNIAYVCNRRGESVSVVDLAKQQEVAQIAVMREPTAAAITPDGSRLVVTNLLPLGEATGDHLAAEVTIIDTEKLAPAASVKLPNGSTNLRGVCIDPSGRWAYCVHTVGRFNLPTTQLDRGWMNTSAMSIIDIRNARLEATVLLDSIDEGAADPYGLALTADGATILITLAGTNQLMRVDVKTLHELLEGKLTEAAKRDNGPSSVNLWLEIAKGPAAKGELVNDLMAMGLADLLKRAPSQGIGPRGIIISGKQAVVANYFSGDIALVDLETLKPAGKVAIGEQPPADLVRKGEQLFHDATICFQKWQSCASCHPDARGDGMRWDLLNDGLGNPKRTRSLVRSFEMKPVMSMGVRAEAGVAVRAGFKFILFTDLPEAVPQAVDAYLKNLPPERSPYLAKDGSMSKQALRGKRIFDGKAECATCHSGPLFTDMQMYNVVDPAAYDTPDAQYVTPRLVELFCGAPFLHDGRAKSLMDMLTVHNKGDRHGKTSNLSKQELDDLVLYLLSL